MEIKGKAWLLFEQSGTFRDAFIEAGIPAECVDIDNQHGKTDHIVDLFHAIEEAYEGRPSFLDRITPNDFVMAFFPCIHFCQFAVMYYRKETNNLKTRTERERADYAMSKMRNMAKFYSLLTKLCTLAIERGWRMVVENPWTFTLMQMLWRKPDYIDTDRASMGDYYHKPTAYWFYNCEPEQGVVILKNNNPLNIEKTKSSDTAGVCSLDRSLISPLYAKNFIHSKILGNSKPVKNMQFSIDF